MTPLQRELLRLLVEAEEVVAERRDPSGLRLAHEIGGEHPAELRAEFDRLVATDPVVLDLLWRETRP